VFRCHPQKSGGAKLNGFLIWLDQGGALVFAIFGFLQDRHANDPM
jgi:hypothetical protein